MSEIWGTITLDELSIVMKSLGRNATREELKAMIAEVDDDGSGEIEFEEFLRLMTSKINDGDTVEEMREAMPAGKANLDRVPPRGLDRENR